MNFCEPACETDDYGRKLMRKVVFMTNLSDEIFKWTDHKFNARAWSGRLL